MEKGCIGQIHNRGSLVLGLLLIVALMIPAGIGHANIITDASFEAGAARWTSQDYASSIDNKVARTGTRSIKLINDGGQRHDIGQENISGVKPGTEYVFSVWVRGNNVTGVGGGGKPIAILRWVDANNKPIDVNRYIWAPYGTYTWKYMYLYSQAPPNAVKANITFRSWFDCLTGTTNWDDVSLTPRNLSSHGSLTGTYQAENASYRTGGTIGHHEAYYTGSGYFDPTVANATLQWSNVSGGTNGGNRTLSFRYAVEGFAKVMEVLVNGKSLGSKQPVQTGWKSSWASADWQATLKPGNNTVRLRISAPTAGGPLIDKLDVFQAGGGGTPPPTPTAVPPTITPNGGNFQQFGPGEAAECNVGIDHLLHHQRFDTEYRFDPLYGTVHPHRDYHGQDVCRGLGPQ